MKDQILWNKIKDFVLDKENATFNFTERLARDNAWSLEFAKRVVDEYKKFIYLCCISDSPITPSDSVDQAWHLHLTYTQSYWKDLCQNTLGKEIHHNPTEGGDSEKKKFSNYYNASFDLYRAEFGRDPDSDIWWDNKKRFTDIHFKRINVKRFWLIKKPSPKLLLGLKLLTAIIIAPLLFINADGDGISITLVLLFIGAAFIINKLGGGNKGGRGGSTNNHDSTTFYDDDSGCSSGCSGCSGCGGCGS